MELKGFGVQNLVLNSSSCRLELGKERQVGRWSPFVLLLQALEVLGQVLLDLLVPTLSKEVQGS